jgi:hypothetical protein
MPGMLSPEWYSSFLNSLWWVQYISGTIMLDETLFQSSRAEVPFVDILKKQGILPGIKVDTGLQPIDGTDGETSTQGLPSVAKGSVSFLPPLPRISGEQSPKLSRIYPRTKKNCIVFLLLPNYLVSFSTGGVCLISPGFLVVDEI